MRMECAALASHAIDVDTPGLATSPAGTLEQELSAEYHWLYDKCLNLRGLGL
jgi:hypothetical protein